MKGALFAVALVACGGTGPQPPSPPPTASSARVPAETPAVATALASAGVAIGEARALVLLVPLGDVSTETVEATADALRRHVAIDVEIGARLALPVIARTPIAGRWSAPALVDALSKIPRGRAVRTMGIAAVDIVIRKGPHPHWGILGLASGPACVLSTHRMKRAWESGGAPESLVEERLWKIAVHELGHTLGLPHCPRPQCVMEDAHGTVATVDREVDLCDACRARITRVLADLAR